MTEEELAARIFAARKRAGLTQRQLADAIGMSMSTVCRWESATYSINALDLLHLAQALQVPLSFFLPNSAAEDYWYRLYHELRAQLRQVIGDDKAND